MMQAACVALQSRATESAIPECCVSEVVRTSQSGRSTPAALPPVVYAIIERPAVSCPASSETTIAAITSFHPFPHAIRAP